MYLSKEGSSRETRITSDPAIKQAFSCGCSFVMKEALAINVYGMTTQPVTGTTSGKEEYALTCEEGPLFVKNGEGSLAISFSILHRPSGEMMDFRTSLLSYADFYRKGQRYE